MSKAVKKAISLPADLAAEAEAIARDENKSLSAIVQDALRALKRSRLRGEFRELQGYWSGRARAAGILSERDLEHSSFAVCRKAALEMENGHGSSRQSFYRHRSFVGNCLGDSCGVN
jgi:hypothetical protein